MAKASRFTFLFILTLLLLTAVPIGHFVVDAVCLGLEVPASYGCAAGNVSDVSSGSAASPLAEIHGIIHLPLAMLVQMMSTYILTLAAVVLTLLAFSPAPSSPPPRRFH